MRIYIRQVVINGIVWTTYTENGQTFEGRGFSKADWKARVELQRKWLAAEKRWGAADRRFTRAMKAARYALVHHTLTDAQRDRYSLTMDKAIADMNRADADMAECVRLAGGTRV